MGISTLAILIALQETGGEHHVAIDPNQSGPAPEGWRGIGITSVERAGLAEKFELLEEPSYLALPALLRQKRQFDLILIDGWHSFDYTFVDYFYADLLLRDGGLLIFDDATMPQVHRVCDFVETHKAYRRIGPPEAGHPLNPLVKMRERRLRRGGYHPVWGSIYAYQKLRSTTVPWSFFESDYYPHFRLYRWWMRLRGRKPRSPTE